jgi:hypothetical protein
VSHDEYPRASGDEQHRAPNLSPLGSQRGRSERNEDSDTDPGQVRRLRKSEAKPEGREERGPEC